jgi:F5/8 type C domain
MDTKFVIFVALSVVGLITTVNGVYGLGAHGPTGPSIDGVTVNPSKRVPIPGTTGPIGGGEVNPYPNSNPLPGTGGPIGGGEVNPHPEVEYKILVPYNCKSYNLVFGDIDKEGISLSAKTCFELRDYSGIKGVAGQQWIQGNKVYDGTFTMTPLFGGDNSYGVRVFSDTIGKYEVKINWYLVRSPWEDSGQFSISGGASYYPQPGQLLTLDSITDGEVAGGILADWKPPAPCNYYTDYPIAAVTAKTSESSFPPQNAKDRDIDTKWVSTSTLKPWIKADLGHLVSVCKVLVYWGDGSSHQYRFIVSVSSDGTTFTKVFSGKSAGTLERYSFPNTIARYVRIMVTESTPGDTNSIAQISEMFVNKDPF